MATKVKERKEFVIVCEDTYVSEPMTEQEIMEYANGQREQYIQDEVDPEYIKENFPNALKNVSEAKEWLNNMGEALVTIPEKMGEIQRIFSKLYNNNGSIHGKIKKFKEDYFDQGYWTFKLKVIDLDENMSATLQLHSRKMCPSGAWDNGIEVVERPRVSLYQFKGSIDKVMRDIINNNFRSDKGSYGSEYRIENFIIE